MRTEAIVEAGPLKSVAVGHFNGVYFGLVQCTSDVLNVFDRVLVTDRMAAVTQGHVRDVEFLAGIKCHVVRPQLTSDLAMRSAVPSAADVMMSRLPA